MKLQVIIAVFTPLLLALVVLPQNLVSAAEPAWYPYVVARGPDRIAIQNTPMQQRPYRPMHFYGNAVRRSYHRGTPTPSIRSIAPLTRSVVRSTRSLLLRR